MWKHVLARLEGLALRLATLPKSLYAAVGMFVGMALAGGTAYAVTTPPPTTTTTVAPVVRTALAVVKTGFSKLQGDLVSYLGYAAVLVVAIAGIAIGLAMLIHWAKRSAHS